MTHIKKAIDGMNKVVSWIVIAMISVLAVLVFIQVLCRNNYIPLSIPWSEEMSRFLLIWITFLGSSLAVRRGSLITLDIVVNLLPEKLRKTIIEISSILSVVFIIVVIYCGFLLLKLGMTQVSPSLQINMAVSYAALPVGGIIMLINTAANALERWRVK